jgi:hypothetical protein
MICHTAYFIRSENRVDISPFLRHFGRISLHGLHNASKDQTPLQVNLIEKNAVPLTGTAL